MTNGYGMPLETKALQIALQEGVSGSVDGLDVRYNIMPRFDLLDENKADINVGEWKQPVNGNYTVAETDTLIYAGIRNQYQKVIIFTGIRALQRDIYATSVRFDAGPATVAIEDIQDLISSSPGESFGVKAFERPYYYNTKLPLRIYLRPRTDGVGQHDKLMFTGIVVEPQGVNIA